MYSQYLNIRCILFLTSILFTFSCKSQLTKDKKVKFVESVEITNDANQRVDSILQFSVMITEIFEDSKGNFWFGSHGDGLCRFDGKVYTYFTANRGLPNGVMRQFAPGPDWSIVRTLNSGSQIRGIQEDQQGNILIRNGSDVICKFDGTNFNVVKLEGQSKTLPTLSGKDWEDELNDLWFSGWSSGVDKYDGVTLTNYIFPEPYSAVKGISEIYNDHDGNIYFGTMEYGAYRYDGVNFEQILEGGIYRSIFQDKSGRTWIGNNKLAMFYLEGDSLVNFTEEYRTLHKNSMPDSGEELDNAQSMEQDENGDLWVGTFSSGLWRYDGKDLTHYTEVAGLSIVTVKTIYKDKRGKLWFGIGEGSVYGFNEESFYRFDGNQNLD